MKNILGCVCLLTLLITTSCTSVQIQNEMGLSNEVTEDSYKLNKAKLGVVLFDAKW